MQILHMQPLVSSLSASDCLSRKFETRHFTYALTEVIPMCCIKLLGICNFSQTLLYIVVKLCI
jgi:hypothetical protein